MAKAKTKEKTSEDKKHAFYSDIYNSVLDKTEKHLSITTGIEQKDNKISSGVLVHDLVMGGGISPGMYSISGPEQSAKSTYSMHLLGSTLKNQVPIILYFDAENAIDGEYTSKILDVNDLTDVFGEKNSKGKWIKPAKARYYDTSVLETVFTSMRSVLNSLPDKIYRAEEDCWYLVFDRKKKFMEKMKEMQKSGLASPVKHLYTETGRYWCPVGDDGNLQAIFFIDSYPSLLSESIDDDEEYDKNDMASDARMFAKYLKRVKGKLRKKRAILWGVNQLGLKPGVKYGSPEYEKGGESLRYFSDVRNQLRARASGGVPGGFKEEEDSLFSKKRKDTYAYKLFKNTKNKKGTPFLTGWSRVWVSDFQGEAHGFDPVFDCYQYLLMTGQIKGPKKKFTINMKKLEDVIFDWNLFKAWILSNTTSDKDVAKVLTKHCKDKTGLKKIPNIYNECRKQLASGEAKKLFVSREDENDGEDLEDLEDDED